MFDRDPDQVMNWCDCVRCGKRIYIGSFFSHGKKKQDILCKDCTAEVTDEIQHEIDELNDEIDELETNLHEMEARDLNAIINGLY